MSRQEQDGWSTWSMSGFNRWTTEVFTIPAISFRWWWPEVDLSYLRSGWNLQESLRSLDFSVVDDALWTVVTVLESLALATMLCCFFVSCGCTI
ncbi:uncharacterized protein [Rutidosis leptorrhynchoides]|uniref:uncharacterized protein n=1 Tax=Rutidosis leptorrhynchoides TaxID=125765 RepID=UPI003A9941F4